MYTTYKEGSSHTLRNDEIFKSVLKVAFKDNRDTICIYININNLHFNFSFNLKVLKTYPRTYYPHQCLPQDLATEIL